jgi:hypothetical protein
MNETTETTTVELTRDQARALVAAAWSLDTSNWSDEHQEVLRTAVAAIGRVATGKATS